MQVLLHPIWLFEESSHVSSPTFNPSPQTGEQMSADMLDPPEHYQPGITPKQLLRQPLLSLGIASSQVSPTTHIPSPQL